MKTPRALLTSGLLASLLLCVPVLGGTAQAATKSSHSASRPSAEKKAPAAASRARQSAPKAATGSKKAPAGSSKKAPAGSKSAPAAAKAPASASKAAPAAAQSCRTVKNKKGKSVRVCNKAAAAPAEPVDPALKSPISGASLDAASRQPDKDESKVRAAPERAYAVDGQSFFYQGRKYRIAGASGLGTNDMAKQRLQKALESGTLSIDPVSTDDGGVATATVRVNGRDLADQLK